MTDTTSAAPVAWRVHPFDYGIGHEGVYAMTMLEQQRDAWLRKGWKVEPLYVAPRAAMEPLTDGLLQQHNRDSQELRRLCAERDQARSERDALKAEIAGLESSCSTLGRLVDELRPDAERLEWVLRRCAGSWLRAYIGVVSDTSDMDTLRTLIDANRGVQAAHGICVKKGESNGLPT